jgi:MoxR-like ATPase
MPVSMLHKLQAAHDQVARVIVGKSLQIKLSLTCLLAGGHLLIEDIPGVGKTTLAHTLAITLGLKFQRVQFTSDLLPADLTGVSIYDRNNAAFVFHPGPVFSQVLLADEINRASPKTQSALLEAMEERQVSVEGETRNLPAPFFVIATQNPFHQVGTFPLPESQLDRFLMCLSLGYPDPRAERALLEGEDRRHLIARLTPMLQPGELTALRDQSRKIHASATLLDYLQALVTRTRASNLFAEGLSPRAALSVLSAARAWALIEGRDHLLPEDVKAILPAAASHRLRGSAAGGGKALSGRELVDELLRSVPIP